MSDLISREELREQQSNGSVPTIIDVRGPKEFASGHLQGAINIPVSQLSRKLKKVPQSQPVVTYCNMFHPGSSRGERAAELLTEQGYEARALDGGFPNWKQAGLPVDEPSHT